VPAPGNFFEEHRVFLSSLPLKSSLAALSAGSLSRYSYGLVASMIGRELKPLRSRGIAGSRGPLQQRRMTSMFSDSDRVDIA
jgi:hypothetical protein